LTLAFGMIPYFLAGHMAVTESRAVLEMRRIEAEQHGKGVEKRDRNAGEAADAGEAQTASGPPAAGAANAGTRSATAVGDEAFAAAVIRTTAAVLLIGLVFVFGGLFRYSMRLAAYYDEKADSLRLLEAGEQQLEERLAQITLPSAAAGGSSRRRVARI
jgi:hypothetical protein